jgi:hypothetical protein
MSQQKPLARPITEEAAAPIYVTTEDDLSPMRGVRPDFLAGVNRVPAVRGRWYCPHCKMIFLRRKPCVAHMGLRPDHPASCRVLINADNLRRMKNNPRFVVVELTQAEHDQAVSFAEKRLKRAWELHRKGKNKQPTRKLWEHNVRGVLGEYAYCKWKQLPLSLIDHYEDDLRAATGGIKPADFDNIEVRAKQKAGYYLLIQEDDPIERIYVLASADPGDLVVIFCGWVLGPIAKQNEFWRTLPDNDDRPCYCYHERLLEPMSRLP